MPSHKLRHHKPYRVVNDLDCTLDEFSLYRKEFYKITRRIISHEEWYSLLHSANVLKFKKKKAPLKTEDIGAISKLFDEEHPYLRTHITVPTLIMAQWAKHIGLVSDDELDEINRKWRTAR